MNISQKPPPSTNRLRRLGPGLITGAADDDPSGIATYSQVGAQFGYSLAWTMLFSLPFMIVVQEICARIGCVTGRGIADNLRLNYPPWLVRSAVFLLLIANTINVGADLGAMGAALRLLFGGNPLVYTLLFGVFCVAVEIFVSYARYAGFLKWLTLSLFAYVSVVFVIHVPWKVALGSTFIPHIKLNAESAMALVAVLGTTISPFLFFWQAALETEECHLPGKSALKFSLERTKQEFGRIRVDTWTGMLVSNVIAIFIIYATAATLHAHGITNIQTSSQAAEALRPIAGKFTFALFAGGIIGTGLLAVPVMAGSGAYALAETFQWSEGLDRGFRQAKAFYITIALSTLLGVGINFTALDPVKALYWSAILNGILSAPVMAVVMLIAGNRRIMGPLTLPTHMLAIGWCAVFLMFAASIGLFVF